MKRATLISIALALAVSVVVPASAFAAFGIKDLAVSFTEADGSPATQAGSHPYAWTTNINFNTKPNTELGFDVPDGSTKNLRISAPPGLVGNPTATARCSTLDFLGVGGTPKCSAATQVGVSNVTYDEPGNSDRRPVFNLIPPPGVAAKFGFVVIGVPVTIEATVNPNPPYNIIASLTNVPQALPVYGAETTIWGYPADPRHDSERENCSANCSVNFVKKPFLTMPRSCTGPLKMRFEAESWGTPTFKVGGEAETQNQSIPPTPVATTGCSRLGLSPDIAAQPTTNQAESSSGLDFNLDITDEGLGNPDGAATQSDIKKAVVTLPVGVTANPSLAEGLGTCSEADLGRETVKSEVGEGCPQSSKIGTVEVETPLLEGTLLKGELFIASQNQNPFGSLLAIYLVIRNPELGILVKLPGRIDPDPQTGQLVTTFGEAPYEIPQFPFSHLRFHFREGGRSPLVTPPLCGKYEVRAEFTPWSGGAPATTTAPFNITSGVGGGPCPAGGVAPFRPGFEAGAMNNNAGSYSPYYLRLSRGDGEQDLTKFSTTLPPGSLAKLVGVAKCTDAQIAAARTKTGRQELAAPSCPASSQVGRVLGGAGVGSQLTYVPGKVYLAGPVNGAPLSVVGIVPAVAGPFDVGTVVTRQALTLDPETGEAQVDGSRSDPIPHILAGIPLKIRDIRVYVDRPDFTLNPTSCDRESFRARMWGGGANVFSSADDIPVNQSVRFQAANCSSLKFKPKLSLKLTGGTKRGDHPALRSILTYPKGGGYANVGKAVVTLPPSEFIDNAHINNPCTRVQFNVGKCPKGSILGTARAFTPLLAEPLEGPVYFRSNGGERLLPDVVADLNGQFHIILVGEVDSKNARIRTTFRNVPDAPASKFVLNLNGGKRGLLVNNRNLCANPLRAKVDLTAQNNLTYNTNPLVANSCGKKKSKAAAGPRGSRR